MSETVESGVERLREVGDLQMPLANQLVAESAGVINPESVGVVREYFPEVCTREIGSSAYLDVRSESGGSVRPRCV